jgi:hypothetical protein
MPLRLFPFLILLATALLPSGCASSDERADDASIFQAAPEKPEDNHGWGANVQGMGR